MENLKNNGQKKDEVSGFALALQNMSNTQACCWILALVIAMAGSIFVIVFHKIEWIIPGYISALLSCLILSSFSLPHLVNYCKNEDVSFTKRMLGSFGVNFFFLITPIVYVDNFYKNLSESLYVKVLSFIVFILLLIIIYCCIDKKNINKNDVSLLKASNLFLTFLTMAIRLIFEEKNILEEYYFSLPLIGLQGLYELLDRKSKKPTENATTSDTAS